MNLFKKDYEFILDLLNTELKKHHIDSQEYEYIEGLYNDLNDGYEDLLEITQEDTFSGTLRLNQCMGCGMETGGRICRECSGV